MNDLQRRTLSTHLPPLGAKEVGARLGISSRTAARRMASQEIAAWKEGREWRCLPAALEGYISDRISSSPR
jgi:hypothetical protein